MTHLMMLTGENWQIPSSPALPSPTPPLHTNTYYIHMHTGYPFQA